MDRCEKDWQMRRSSELQWEVGERGRGREIEEEKKIEIEIKRGMNEIWILIRRLAANFNLQNEKKISSAWSNQILWIKKKKVFRCTKNILIFLDSRSQKSTYPPSPHANYCLFTSWKCFPRNKNKKDIFSYSHFKRK